jgi:hypothetical protein
MVKAIRASMLVLLLACSAHAGDMPNGSPQMPSQLAAYTERLTRGTASKRRSRANYRRRDAKRGTASVTEITLSLLAGLPSLF